MFSHYVFSGYPLLWVETFEEYRALVTFCHELQKNSKESYRMYVWDRVDGIKVAAFEDGDLKFGKPSGDSSKLDDPMLALNWIDSTFFPEGRAPSGNAVFFMKDFHPYIKKDAVLRKIRNLIPKFRGVGITLIMISPLLDIPREIEKEVTVVPFSLPTREELKMVLQGVVKAINDQRRAQGETNEALDYPKNDESLIDSALGLTALEAENAFSISMVEKKSLSYEIVQREKAATVKKTNLLESLSSPYDQHDVGGLENVKDWLIGRRDCFGEKALKFGIKPPKGILLMGIPGTGKTLVAKVCGNILRRPVLKLEISKILDQYVGGSEANLRKVLAIAEATSPCVLFIDELEKFFSNAEDSHEVTKHVLGTFLSWLNDKTADVFVVATANEVNMLPPALLRGGRFDVLFWVDLPGDSQREEILDIQLRHVGRDMHKILSKSEIAGLVQACVGFTGAEIETWVKEGLVYAFKTGEKELNHKSLTETVSRVTPIAKLMSKNISDSRQWAVDHGVQSASLNKVEDLQAAFSGRKIQI